MFVYELIILHVCLCMTLHTLAYGNFIYYVDHVGVKLYGCLPGYACRQ